MRGPRPALVAAALLLAAISPAAAGALQNDSLLQAPGNYSLAPPSLLQGGEATSTVGSNGLRTASVRLDSGLIGGNTRAFLQLGTGQGPRWHDRPSLSGNDVAVGVETALPHGMTLGFVAGYEHDRLTGGYPLQLDRQGR